MRVVIYSRVSTADQADSGVSLEAQEAKLTAYAGVFDLQVVEAIADAGESAKSLNRPGLQRALTMLKRGEADGLAVVKLDRLTRSVGDWQALIDGYFGERAGKQLFSVGDSIDTRTAAGRLVLNVLMSVAAWEREAIGERTREALRHKIRCNQRCGKVRFGYDLAADGKTLVPNMVEQQAIDLMASLRAAGHTLRRIAAELTQRGVGTKEGGRDLDAYRCWPHPRAKGRMMSKKRSIVEQLRSAMKNSGQTEYAIAKGSGVSQSVVNRFINGERGISLETAAKLCSYLELDLHPRR